MKLYLSTDFEGTSGIVAWEQIIEGNAEYEQGRKLLTAEVNAVIAGAMDAGDDLLGLDANYIRRSDAEMISLPGLLAP